MPTEDNNGQGGTDTSDNAVAAAADAAQANATEGTDTTETAESSEQVSEGHPAWKEILDVIPDDLQHLVKPTLEKWDKGVQEKFQEIHSQYDPYKPLIENNVPSDAIEKGLYLLTELEQDPAAMVDKMVETFGLDYVKKAAAEAGVDTSDLNLDDDDDLELDDDDDEYIDVMDDPRVKALVQEVKSIKEDVTTRKQREEMQQKQQAFTKLMNDLHTEYGEFDDIYVTALMSNGVNGAEAVKKYHDTINQAAAKIAGSTTKPTVPVVMGADGTSGSGVPSQPVDFGKMKNSDVDDTVIALIEKAKQEAD